MVFLFYEIHPRVLNTILRFAAGVMIAASFWMLLLPAIELTRAAGGAPWRPALICFLLGGAFLWGIDRKLPHLHLGLNAQ